MYVYLLLQQLLTFLTGHHPQMYMRLVVLTVIYVIIN